MQSIHKTEIRGHTTLAMAFSLIMGERCRQIERGFDAAHDKSHGNSELCQAGAAMAIRSQAQSPHQPSFELGNKLWPWKDGLPRHESSTRDLIVAASLLVAEIERRLEQDDLPTIDPEDYM
jgi:hypothetical protein